MGSDLTDIIVLLGFLVAIVAGSRYLVNRGRRVQEAGRRRAEMLERLVEKFGSAEELVAFARSPEGRQFLAATDTPAVSQRHVLRLFQAGVVLVAMGSALLVNAARTAPGSESTVMGPAAEANWWGTLSLCLGLGLLAIGAISYRLGQRWGLLNSGGGSQDRPG